MGCRTCADGCPNCGADVDTEETRILTDRGLDYGWVHWCTRCPWEEE